MLYCALNLNLRIAFGGTYKWNALGVKSVRFDSGRMGIVKNMYLYLNAGSRLTPCHDDNIKAKDNNKNNTSGSRLTARRNDGATNYDRQKAKTSGSRLTARHDDGYNTGKTSGLRLTARRNDDATNYDKQKAKTTGSRLTPCRDDGGLPRSALIQEPFPTTSRRDDESLPRSACRIESLPIRGHETQRKYNIQFVAHQAILMHTMH